MAHIPLHVGCEVPDPFLIAQPEGYYLTGTCSRGSGRERRYDLFFSRDLIDWEFRGGLLLLPEFPGSEEGHYWAPEILRVGNTFYLYYTADSCRDPEKRHVRVAVAAGIAGPYRDLGPLTQRPSIDGHPFADAHGNLYLMFTGNEGSPFMGQLLIDRLLQPDQAEGKPRKVFPDETVEWEEGAFTLRHDGRYLLFTSMGNWRDGSYLVRVSRFDSPQGPFTRILSRNSPFVLLATADGRNGPGHCSVFTAHDNTLYLCYHAWDVRKTGRYPWIVPLAIEDHLPRVVE